MKNRLPLGGGWNNYEGGFIYWFFEIPTFHQGGCNDRQEVEVRKIRRRKFRSPAGFDLSVLVARLPISRVSRYST
jgi:hypothetical protein